MVTSAVLTDDDFVVPPAAGYGWAPGGIGWLRASVARFSSGEVHRRRRDLIRAELSRVDGDAVRAAAHARALGSSDSPDVAEVPVVVLAEALGMSLGVRDVPVAAVAAVAEVYLTGVGGDHEAVATLVTAFGGVPDERTAALISLLVQTYAATAALVRAAVATGEPGELAVARVLRTTPPVPRTRRVAVVDTHVDGQAVRAGTLVDVDLADAPFGAGPHACPGRDLAIAMAEAVVDAVRR